MEQTHLADPAVIQTSILTHQTIRFSHLKVITIPRWKQYVKCEKITKSSLDIRSPNPAYLRDGKLKDFVNYIINVQEGRSYGSLERLILDFANCYELRWRSFTELLNKIILRFRNIKYLDLSLSRSELASEEAVEGVATIIGSKCVNLTHLNLNFTFCYNAVTNKSIKRVFIEILFNLKSLNSLILDLTQCITLSKLPFEELMDENTPKFKTLQKLVLDLSYCHPLSDKTIQELALYIGKHLKYLKHLELDLTCCNSLTDQTVTQFAEQIGSNLKYLECFGFRLSNCNKLTEKPLEAMAKILSDKLPNLKGLCFGYHQENSELINGDSIISLFWQIQLKNLEYLRLNLSNCTALTDEMLKILSAEVSLVQKRQLHLELNFAYCSSLTDQGLLDFCEQIKSNFTNLQNLRINLTKCQSIQDLTKISAKDMLQEIPFVDID